MWLDGLRLATLVGGRGHHRRNLRENRADAAGNARHDSAGGNGHETRHQSIFDEVLTALIFPNLQLQKQILHFLFLSPLPGIATGVCRWFKVIIGRLRLESGLLPNVNLEIAQEADF